MKRPNINLAKKLRHNSTPPEIIFWHAVRDRRLNGHKFRRQYPIGKFVADFVCVERLLIVELDGGQHNDDEHERNDSERTAWLEANGYRVIRFWNSDVMNRLPDVLEEVGRWVDTPSPQPSPPRGRGGID